MDYPHFSSPMAYGYGMSGGVLLTATSAYAGLATGQSPLGTYVGFKVGSAGATISAVSHGEYAKFVTTAPGQTLIDLPLVAGETYYIPVAQVTLSAGALYLIKA